MKITEVQFSEARQKLSSIVDQVEQSGTPVKIFRRGKLVAVVVNAEEYELKSRKKKPFKLAGSMKVRKGIDVDKVLAQVRKESIKAAEASAERLQRELDEP